MLAAGAVPAAALPAPTRHRARNDEPASMSVIVCATSYGIDVVVIAVIIVLQLFAAHCSNSASVPSVPSVLEHDAAVCASPLTLFVPRIRRSLAVACAPASLTDHLHRQEADLLSNTEEHFCNFCIQGRHFPAGTGH